MKSDLYSKHAEKYDSVIQDNIYNAHFERPSLQALLDDVLGLDILDLGCGSGVYAEFLLKHGASSVTCIDSSEKMIEIVNNKLGDRVLSYFQDLSIGLPQEKSNSIDLIICPLVLHYLEDLSMLFKDVNRVLKVGGHIAFSTHHPFADFKRLKSENYFERELVNDVWDTIGEPVEVTYYRRSLTEIMNAITNNGLVVTRLSEGVVSEKVMELSEKHYRYLSNNPNFLFIKCQKSHDMEISGT